MNYLVLGGNGFIGMHLVKALCNEGHDVRMFGRRPVDSESLPENAKYITGDFTDTPAVAQALVGVDVVYHLISTTIPSSSNLDMVADIQANLVSTVRLLQAMVDAGVNKIVFFSSGGTVYGNPDSNPIQESHPLNPICSYGVVKVAIEKYLFLFKQLHGVEYNILRVSNPYGPNQQRFGVQGVIPTFLLKALKNEPISIWGDGSIERDYIYINDLIHVSVSAGKVMHNEIYNISSGIPVSINQIIEVIESITNKKLMINKLPPRNFDVQSIALDNSKAQRHFDWSPAYALREGVSVSWDWLKNNY